MIMPVLKASSTVLIHGEPFKARNEMRRQVFEYIEHDYNKQRRHSAIGMISPEIFESQMIA